MTLIEFQRLRLQEQLDSLKSQAARNRLGQFATPTDLAMDIFRYAKLIMPKNAKVRFLDPAFGTGAFYSALLSVFSPSRIGATIGYEIDRHYGDETLNLWKHTPLDLRIVDFTTATPPENGRSAINLLICNPPYVRHHHILPAQKIRLQEKVHEITGERLSGLAGLYSYFMLLAHAWLGDGGLAGWLVPSEFMDVGYGKQVKNYLTTKVTLLRVHRFDPQDVQFDDALVSSAIVWYRKATPPHNHAVEFSYGGSLCQPKVSKRITLQSLRSQTKWNQSALSPGSNTPSVEQKLSDFFEIRRGLATGANEFFILTPEQIARHQIPREVLKPILPSPRYLSHDEIQADSEGNPVLEHPLFLLDCGLPEDEVKARYPMLWKYLQSGIERGINLRYLCSHRSPWYMQENRPAPPVLCTYMGRQDTKRGRPFRFILNHSKATAPNVYLLLYPKRELAAMTTANPVLMRRIWQRLCGVSTEAMVNEGRVYGGGLHKVEPKELGNLSAAELLDLFSY